MKIELDSLIFHCKQVLLYNKLYICLCDWVACAKW
jgi:hypothetical protein